MFPEEAIMVQSPVLFHGILLEVQMLSFSICDSIVGFFFNQWSLISAEAGLSSLLCFFSPDGFFHLSFSLDKTPEGGKDKVATQGLWAGRARSLHLDASFACHGFQPLSDGKPMHSSMSLSSHTRKKHNLN